MQSGSLWLGLFIFGETGLISTASSMPGKAPVSLHSMRDLIVPSSFCGLSRQLGERLLLFEPRLIGGLAIDHDFAAHHWMPYPA
jgi:hypothetical protein